VCEQILRLYKHDTTVRDIHGILEKNCCYNYIRMLLCHHIGHIDIV